VCEVLNAVGVVAGGVVEEVMQFGELCVSSMVGPVGGTDRNDRGADAVGELLDLVAMSGSTLQIRATSMVLVSAPSREWVAASLRWVSGTGGG
jgi:hypothetical protein